jgi:hypothetical protein
LSGSGRSSHICVPLVGAAACPTPSRNQNGLQSEFIPVPYCDNIKELDNLKAALVEVAAVTDSDRGFATCNRGDSDSTVGARLEIDEI